MTSPLRRKRPTTPPSIPRRTNRSRPALVWLATAIVLSVAGSDLSSAAAPLQWGRPSQTRQPTANFRRPQYVRRDAAVVAAAWEQDDASLPRLSANPLRSVIVKRSETETSAGNDPFDVIDRIAQLPADPFDEPANQAEPLPEPELDDVDDIADALKSEIERRETASEPVDDLLEELRDVDLQADEFDEDWLTEPITDEAAEEQLRSGKDDLDLDLDSSDDEPTAEPTPQQRERLRKQLAKEREANDKNCEEEFAKLQADGIHGIDLSIRIDGNAGEDYPHECSLGNESHEDRQWPQITYTWKASGICHKPLYFEQVQLERYGHSWGPYLQPIMSGVHFFGSVPILPYKMGIRTPSECVYTLGYYRPGSCAPYLIDPVPFTWRAALFEAGVATGASFAIP